MTEILKKDLHFARISGKIVKLIILIPYFTLGGASTMAKCECCGKGVTFGIKVSHSHRRSNRTWKPNVRRVKLSNLVYVAGHFVEWPAFFVALKEMNAWLFPPIPSCC